MREIVSLLAAYDAGTKTHGASCASPHWGRILAELGAGNSGHAVNLPRELGSLVPGLVRMAVRDISGRRSLPLLLGGDHSLTWFALEPLVETYGALDVVHFDAHHDAYESHLLNHYTVFGYAIRYLPIRVHSVGVRHDGDGVTELAEEISGKCYVTVDVDYFDPAHVASVVHAVPAPPRRSYDLAAFRRSLSKITGEVVGADVVEWKGADAGSGEYEFVKQVVGSVRELLVGRTW